MKILKTAFLVALFNYLIVGSVVLALKKVNDKEPNNTSPTLAEVTAIPTPDPTQTPVPTQTVAPTRKIVKSEDPFAIIFNGAAPTNKPANGVSNTSSGNNPTSAPATTANNPTSPPQQQAQPTADTRCIITVHGAKYDVTIFRNQHSGGNVFSCGAEMTSTFDSQHPMSFLNKMAQYKI